MVLAFAFRLNRGAHVSTRSGVPGDGAWSGFLCCVLVLCACAVPGVLCPESVPRVSAGSVCPKCAPSTGISRPLQYRPPGHAQGGCTRPPGGDRSCVGCRGARRLRRLVRAALLEFMPQARCKHAYDSMQPLSSRAMPGSAALYRGGTPTTPRGGCCGDAGQAVSVQNTPRLVPYQWKFNCATRRMRIEARASAFWTWPCAASPTA